MGTLLIHDAWLMISFSMVFHPCEKKKREWNSRTGWLRFSDWLVSQSFHRGLITNNREGCYGNSVKIIWVDLGSVYFNTWICRHKLGYLQYQTFTNQVRVSQIVHDIGITLDKTYNIDILWDLSFLLMNQGFKHPKWGFNMVQLTIHGNVFVPSRCFSLLLGNQTWQWIIPLL